MCGNIGFVITDNLAHNPICVYLYTHNLTRTDGCVPNYLVCHCDRCYLNMTGGRPAVRHYESLVNLLT